VSGFNAVRLEQTVRTRPFVADTTTKTQRIRFAAPAEAISRLLSSRCSRGQRRRLALSSSGRPQRPVADSNDRAHRTPLQRPNLGSGAGQAGGAGSPRRAAVACGAGGQTATLEPTASYGVTCHAGQAGITGAVSTCDVGRDRSPRPGEKLVVIHRRGSGTDAQSRTSKSWGLEQDGAGAVLPDALQLELEASVGAATAARERAGAG
jgi:hypothetical protein